eukprot:5791055-Alexandrium_andersonii.AAC.1
MEGVVRGARLSRPPRLPRLQARQCRPRWAGGARFRCRFRPVERVPPGHFLRHCALGRGHLARCPLDAPDVAPQHAAVLRRCTCRR